MSCRISYLSLFTAATLAADLRAAVLPEFDPTGFTRIFDGESLTDWDGDPVYWNVQDGILRGTVTPDTLLKKNSWIVWKGGVVEDFELVLDYRVSAGGNSGVGYRLAVLENDPYSVRGPQADIHGAPMFTGICYEENGRRLLAARGQSTWIDDPGRLPRLVAQFADPEELQSVVNADDWNRYRLVVRGNHARHILNGNVMSEVHDHDETNRMKRGLVGVQVHVGPPMTIEYRNIWLKHTAPLSDDSTEPEEMVYQSGTLVEPEHAATFDNLARQAARVTAPAASSPPDSGLKRVLVTRDLAVVRHDLTDLRLFGDVRPLPRGRREFDLVVLTDGQTLRVPGEGRRIVGKRHDVPYRVTLQWSDDTTAWTLTDLQPAE